MSDSNYDNPQGASVPPSYDEDRVETAQSRVEAAQSRVEAAQSRVEAARSRAEAARSQADAAQSQAEQAARQATAATQAAAAQAAQAAQATATQTASATAAATTAAAAAATQAAQAAATQRAAAPSPTQAPTQPFSAAPTYPQQQVPVAAQAYQQPAAQAQSAYRQPVYQAPAAGAQKKSGGGARNFLLSFLGAALACILMFSGFGLWNAFSSRPAQAPEPAFIGSGGSGGIASDVDESLAVAVARTTLPSVVNIDVFAASPAGPFGGGLFGDDMVEFSLGSGVILSEDGYIITNYHVIEGADALEVTIAGEVYQADIVGVDPSSDLAVIKARNASGLVPIEIGSSSDLVIGQWVMAIGSPFGLEQSVSTGIVSATSRSTIMESTTGGDVMVYTNLIQTDAAINPGNSGGALVDADGRLIGINTLITSYSGSFSGVGFAIPVDYAINIAQQIIDGKMPSHAQLGVSLSSVDPSLAQRYGLSVSHGAYVTVVHRGSSADSAGIEIGDIITRFDGRAINSASDLMLEIRSKNPGDTVNIEVNRDGEKLTIEVTLGSDAG
ncbi:MAG: trypsin-like peptidase domain-containing protein [Eggerthellaceae bacterium]|nr:trypsin-like peptidase domain-containing protein [Eggerthellaceae bacterium]